MLVVLHDSPISHMNPFSCHLLACYSCRQLRLAVRATKTGNNHTLRAGSCGPRLSLSVRLLPLTKVQDQSCADQTPFFQAI